MAPPIHPEAPAKTGSHLRLLLFLSYLSSPEALPPKQDLCHSLLFSSWLSHCFHSSSSAPSPNNPRINLKKSNHALFSKISGFWQLFNQIQPSQSGRLDPDLILFCPTFGTSLLSCCWRMGGSCKPRHDVYDAHHTIRYALDTLASDSAKMVHLSSPWILPSSSLWKALSTHFNTKPTSRYSHDQQHVGHPHFILWGLPCIVLLTPPPQSTKWCCLFICRDVIIQK